MTNYEYGTTRPWSNCIAYSSQTPLPAMLPRKAGNMPSVKRDSWLKLETYPYSACKVWLCLSMHFKRDIIVLEPSYAHLTRIDSHARNWRLPALCNNVNVWKLTSNMNLINATLLLVCLCLNFICLFLCMHFMIQFSSVTLQAYFLCVNMCTCHVYLVINLLNLLI